MEYNYNDDTLIHSIGFNYGRLESILTYGILSLEVAEEENVSFSKNYLLDKQNSNHISLTRVGSIDYDKSFTAYHAYVKRGISFIVEDVEYIDKKNDFHHQREDEVIVENRVKLDNIKGIIIPREIEDYYVSELNILPIGLSKYTYLYNIVMNYINFLEKYEALFDLKRIIDYLKEILLINNALYSIKDKNNKEDEEELINDYHEVLSELNEYLGEVTFDTFSKILGYPATLKEVVKYIVKDRYEIYDIPKVLSEQKRA